MLETTEKNASSFIRNHAQEIAEEASRQFAGVFAACPADSYVAVLVMRFGQTWAFKCYVQPFAELATACKSRPDAFLLHAQMIQGMGMTPALVMSPEVTTAGMTGVFVSGENKPS